jgi:hypothetical protein
MTFLSGRPMSAPRAERGMSHGGAAGADSPNPYQNMTARMAI